MSLLYRKCLESALEIHEKLHGHNHPSVAVVLGNLGDLWDDARNKTKAISYYQDALAVEEVVYGPNHLEVSYYSMI